MTSKHGLVDNNMKRSSCSWSLRKASILHGIYFRYDRIDRLSRWIVLFCLHVLMCRLFRITIAHADLGVWPVLPLRLRSLQGSQEWCDNDYHSVIVFAK